MIGYLERERIFGDALVSGQMKESARPPGRKLMRGACEMVRQNGREIHIVERREGVACAQGIDNPIAEGLPLCRTPSEEISPQNERARTLVAHPPLCEQFAARVFVQRRRRIAFSVQRMLPGKQVVCRDVNQRNRTVCRRNRRIAGKRGVGGSCQRGISFARVDVGQTSGVDDEVRPNIAQLPIQLPWFIEVQAHRRGCVKSDGVEVGA